MFRGVVHAGEYDPGLAIAIEIGYGHLLQVAAVPVFADQFTRFAIQDRNLGGKAEIVDADDNDPRGGGFSPRSLSE
jgi:hypothetical protein